MVYLIRHAESIGNAGGKTINAKEIPQSKDLIHGKGAESFNQMLKRVDDMFEKIRKIDENKFVVIFTHCLFMRAVLARRNRQTVTFVDVFEGKINNNTDIIEL